MNLRLHYDSGDGGRWEGPHPYIDDGGLTFFLDPNDFEALRIRPDGESWPTPWVQLNMQRVEGIHRRLLDARAFTITQTGAKP